MVSVVYSSLVAILRTQGERIERADSSTRSVTEGDAKLGGTAETVRHLLYPSGAWPARRDLHHRKTKHMAFRSSFRDISTARCVVVRYNVQ